MTVRFELSTAALREEAAEWLRGIGYLVRPAYAWSPRSLVVLAHESRTAEVVRVVARVDPGAVQGVQGAVDVVAHQVGGVYFWLRSSDLDRVVKGADVVVNLTWLFHPSHSSDQTWANNVRGTARILDAVRRAGVPALVNASSIAAYSPAVDDQPVDES